MYSTKLYSEIINRSMCLRVEKFTGAVELEEGKRRLGKRIRFLSKELNVFGVTSSCLEP